MDATTLAGTLIMLVMGGIAFVFARPISRTIAGLRMDAPSRTPVGLLISIRLLGAFWALLALTGLVFSD